METIDEAAITNQAPLPNQGIAEHESFTPSTDDCRRDTVETEEAESGVDSTFCRVGRQRVVLADTFLSAPLRTMRDRFRVTFRPGNDAI
jgi:hypothetical protein